MSPPSEVAERRPTYDAIPLLENGDRLTRVEFERRYEAMPRLKRAELIEGVVYLPSPVNLRHHGQPHYDLIGWLTAYRAKTPGLLMGDNSTVRLDLDNEPQPDVQLLIEPERGGQATIDDDYVEGAPELVAEVAASSASSAPFGTAIRVTEGSELQLTGSTLEGFRSIDARGGSRVPSFVANTLEGRIRARGTVSMMLWDDSIAGELDLRQGSTMVLDGVTQTLTGPGSNRVSGGSTLVARGTTSLAGDFELMELSEAALTGGATVSGSLSCRAPTPSATNRWRA